MKRTYTRSAWKLMEPRDPLDLETLRQRIRQDGRDLGQEMTLMEQAGRTRSCEWSGKSPDGRKWKRLLGKDAAPYEGAPDMAVPAVDETINECKLVMSAAQRAARLEVTGHNSDQDAEARLMVPLVNYVLGTMMADDVSTQSKLWADIMLEHGKGFLHVGWLTRREIEERTVTVDDLLSMALEMMVQEVHAAGGEPDQAAIDALDMMAEDDLWAKLLDPARQAEVITMLQGYDAAMSPAEAARVAAALRQGEAATYFAPYVRESRAFWEALTLGVDLIMSPMTMLDIQRSPQVTRLHFYTAAQVRDMAALEEWDEVETENLIANPGAAWTEWGTMGLPKWVGSTSGVGAEWSEQQIRDAGLYHVAETWHRMPTKAGPSVVFRTLHHGTGKKPLKHGVLQERHGRIPIVPLYREVRGKTAVSPRGVAVLGQSWQSSLKLHFDAQATRTELTTTPPVNVPQRRFKGQPDGQSVLPIGPWKQIPFSSNERDGGISFVQLPGDVGDSVQIQDALRSQMRRYFGQSDASVPATVTQMHQQELAAVFMAALAAAIELTMQLCAQYMDPVLGAKVAGLAVPLNATRDDIQGEWRYKLDFDVKELDMDFLTKKFDLLAKMLAFDPGGAVPRGELMAYVFAAADPVLAQRLKIDKSGGSDAAFGDEQGVISEQVAGQRPKGRLESPASRLQAHWEWVKNPESMQMLQARPSLLAVELARAEALELGMQQSENALTGRTGEAADAPWEEDQKYSDWLKVTFGLASPKQMAQGQVVPEMAA